MANENTKIKTKHSSFKGAKVFSRPFPKATRYPEEMFNITNCNKH